MILIRYRAVRALFLLCLLYLSARCTGQQPQGDTAVMGPGATWHVIPSHAAGQHPAVPAPGKEPESDGSYEKFMDDLISRKDIVFSKKAISAAEDYYFDKMWGPTQRMPPALIIDGVKFLKNNMQIVNEDERLRDIEIWVDTAMVFTFHGRKYGYVEASYPNCNGSGCLETYHFIADFKTRKLYVFDMFAEPSIATPYFGDVNCDGQLDFVVPEYVSVGGSHLPYSDTTEEIELMPYTLSRQGRFIPIMRYDKEDYFLIGRFDGGNFAPRNFNIIAARWFN